MTLTELDARASARDLFKKLDTHFQKLCNGTNYVNKLGKENNWDFQYTVRVIEEYKKFLCIWAITKQPVSPSHPVDLAWHTHILYTTYYFGNELKSILGGTLHHEPESGKNETSEITKLKNWYDSTLESYKVMFGTIPSDIWTTTKSGNYSIPNYEYLKMTRKTFVDKRSFFDKLLGVKREEADSLTQLEDNRYERSLKMLQENVNVMMSTIDLRKRKEKSFYIKKNAYDDNSVIDYLVLDSIYDDSFYQNSIQSLYQKNTDHDYSGSSCSSHSHSSHDTPVHNHSCSSHDTPSHSCSSHSSCSSSSDSSSSSSCGSSCGGGGD